MYIYGWSTRVNIFEKDKKDYWFTANMGYMDRLLPPSVFACICKGIKANIWLVKAYQCLVLRTKSFKILKIKLLMADGKPLVVSKKHVSNVLKLLSANPLAVRKPDTCNFVRWLNKFEK